MGNWWFVDVPRNRKVQLPTPSGVTPATRSALRDFEHMGIRRDGERWWTLQTDDATGWAFADWRPHPSSGQPFHIVPITIPSIPGSFNPLGLTMDGKSFVVSSRDSSGSQPDQLNFYDVFGNLIREAPCSDAPDRDNSRLTFLNHDYYVLAQETGDAPWKIKVYDPRANLIRKFGLSTVTSQEICRGITTDGKFLYVVVTNDGNHVNDRIIKVDVRGTVIRSAWNAGDNQQYLNGLTFNGHYLIAVIDNSPPLPPLT